MWKIATVAVMLLATSAFGAVSITLDNVDGTSGSTAKVPAQTVSSVTMNVNVHVGTDVVDGIGLYVATDTPGVRITGRTITGTKLTFKTYDDADVFAMDPLFNPGDTSNLKDVGVGQANGNAHLLSTDPTGIMSLTWTIPALPAGTVVQIASPFALWAPGPADGSPIWGDGTTITGSPISFAVTVTPEPASMLLLAAGAAFFARRRRA